MFKVFPASLISGQKVPLIKGWREAATDDPAQIKLWQELFRDRLTFWGVPQGAINNTLTLDIDVKKDNGFETLKRLNYEVPNTLQQRTPSGGVHYIFKFDPAKDPGNKVGFLPGCDIRSTGGWIAHYNFSNNQPILDAPDWLYREAFKQKQAEPIALTAVRVAPEIAEGIFRASIDAIINASPGESNNELNIQSYKVGQLVSAGSISREYAEAELFKAAKMRGKPDYESRATIASGLDGGAKHPLVSPFGNVAPTAAFHIPDIPSSPERWTPRFFTREDLLNTSKLRKPQLFKDWSTQDISLFTSDGGVGKSTLSLYESICLALGDRFLGFDCVKPGKSLYITGEDSKAKLGAMIGAILNCMGLFDGTPENDAKVERVMSSVIVKKDSDLSLISKDKLGFFHPSTDALKKIKDAIDDLKPARIVFDPISSFWASEQQPNDVARALTRFMADIAEYGQCEVNMINHAGKAASSSKDMSQFAGRGGSALPSHSRVSRTARVVLAEEFQELTGSDLVGDQTAMLLNVNKFSDGSPIYNQPFIVVRNKYLFNRIVLSKAKVREMEKQMGDKELIFSFVKQCRNKNTYPTKSLIVAHHMNTGSPMSRDRVIRALDLAQFEGFLGEKVQMIANPDLLKKEPAFTISDMDGKEL